MTSPTLLSREVIGTETFEVSRILYCTPRGNCGVRHIYTIGRDRVARLVWGARREAALSKAGADKACG